MSMTDDLVRPLYELVVLQLSTPNDHLALHSYQVVDLL